VAVDQPFDNTTPEGVLMEGMLETLAEYYSLNLANEVMKGLKNNARKAKFNGGFSPLGFKIVEGEYVHDEPAASAMRRVFELFAQGASYNQCLAQIADYRTPIYTIKNGPNKGQIKGGTFYTKAALIDMLHNPKYAGVYVYNRAPQRVEGSRNWHNSKPDDDLIRIPGGIPLIVSKEVFIQVQQRLDRRAERYAYARENRASYVLTGKTICGDCGSPMTGYSKRNNEGKLYRYYYCNAGRRTGKQCLNGHWNKDETEELIANEIRAELLDYARDDSKIERCYQELVALDSNRKDLRAPLERDIRSAEEKISRLLDLAESGKGNLDSIYKRIEENETNLKLLKQELAQVKADLKYDKESVRQYFLNAAKLADNSNPEGLKQLLEKYVERITIHPTGAISTDFIFRPASASVSIVGAEGGT
jgi:site-specific DNA recombinase